MVDKAIFGRSAGLLPVAISYLGRSDVSRGKTILEKEVS